MDGKPQMTLEVYGTIAISTTLAAMIVTISSAAQLILTPENVWLPISVASTVVVGLVSTSIWATIRSVRAFDKLTRNQRRIMRELGIEDE